MNGLHGWDFIHEIHVNFTKGESSLTSSHGVGKNRPFDCALNL